MFTRVLVSLLVFTHLHYSMHKLQLGIHPTALQHAWIRTPIHARTVFKCMRYGTHEFPHVSTRMYCSIHEFARLFTRMHCSMHALQHACITACINSRTYSRMCMTACMNSHTHLHVCVCVKACINSQKYSHECITAFLGLPMPILCLHYAHTMPKNH